MKRGIAFLLAVLMAAAVGACGREVVQEPTEVTTVETTGAMTATTEWTTEPPPTLLPVIEDWDWHPGDGWDEWTEGFPIFLEPAKDYEELLKRYWQVENGGAIDYGNLGGSASSMLHDFDGDFVPELIVVLTFNPSYEWHVYTLYQGQTRFLGFFEGTFRSGLFSHPKGGIYLNHFNNGSGIVSRITKQGNRLVEGEFQEYSAFDENGNIKENYSLWEPPSNSVRLECNDIGEFYW